MSGELEPYEQSPAEMDTEFASYPEEVRQAALEFARGLKQEEAVQLGLEHDADPEFILVGVQQHGRHILFASTAVKATRFGRRVTGVDRVAVAPGRYARIPRISILVGAELTSFEQILGDDYRQALQTLLGQWSRKARAAASPPPRAIAGEEAAPCGHPGRDGYCDIPGCWSNREHKD